MPRNSMVPVGQTPVQLTASDALNVFVHNEGPGSIRVIGSSGAGTPAELVGPLIPAGYAVPLNLPTIFPGISGVRRLWAVAATEGATVFVSHGDL